MQRSPDALRITTLGALALLGLAAGVGAAEVKPRETLRVHVQVRPGGPVEAVDMPVFTAPVNPRSVAAEAAGLADDELVLGVVAEGEAMAYPIRYIALYEVVDDRVGDTALASTW